MSSSVAIAELINEWVFFRDQERWDDLLGAFNEDGFISLSWFRGPYPAFVAASQQMAQRRSAIVKHHIGVPKTRINGNRALSETSVIIRLRVKSAGGDVDTTSYARFYDQLERRDGTWKFSIRTGIYEMDRVDPVDAPVLPDSFFCDLDLFPAPVKFLGSSLKRVGNQLIKETILDRSAEMLALYAAGDDWLNSR